MHCVMSGDIHRDSPDDTCDDITVTQWTISDRSGLG